MKFLWARLLFPVDSARAKRRLAFLWWEPAVLLLPWRARVAFWNWLFDLNFDWRCSSDPFMQQWLQNYWPFHWHWVPDFVQRAVLRYAFPPAGQQQAP